MSRPREVVVVTGASAGVGRAVVREFAARGQFDKPNTNKDGDVVVTL